MAAPSANPMQVDDVSTCQDVIQKHLKVDPARCGDALVLLCQSEVKQPAPAAGDMLHCNTACCFDLENKVPTWAASRLCARCDAINHMLHVTEEGGSMRDVAITTTQCASEEARAGVVPTLPVEIIEMILSAFTVCPKLMLDKDGRTWGIDFLLHRLGRDDINESIKALLHTSRGIRSWIASRMPVQIPARDEKAENQAKSTERWVDVRRFDDAIDAFVQSAVERYLLEPAQTQPKPWVTLEDDRSILNDNALVQQIVCQVIVLDSEGSSRSLITKRIDFVKTGNAMRGGARQYTSLKATHIHEVLAEAFCQVQPSPRLTSPHYRAHHWSTHRSDPTASISVKIEVQDRRSALPLKKFWIFNDKDQNLPVQHFRK